MDCNCPIKSSRYRYYLSILFVVLSMTGCATSFEGRVAKLADQMTANDKVAVSWFYDAKTGDVTALGDQWRTRVETALHESNVEIKARKDIGFIIDDIETYGVGGKEKAVWAEAGADVLITGEYDVEYSVKGKRKRPKLRVTVKALQVDKSAVIGSFVWHDELDEGWVQRAATVKGNVFQKKLEVTEAGTGATGPPLSALLDHTPACYPVGAPAVIRVDTAPGAHVYILNLAADNTVTLLYPNSRLPDQPLTSGRLDFPPQALAKQMQLVLYPLVEGEMCHESFKVIASQVPLDFSYLPVPECTVYAGAQGGDIGKVVKTLQGASGWSETLLDYWVGAECRN